VSVEVRPATLDDVEEIVEVAVRSWQEGFRGIVPVEIDPREEWGPNRVRARLAGGDGGVLRAVGELDGRVRGFMVFGQSRDSDADLTVGEIWALYVHPEAWRRGVGRALVEHALGELGGAGFREATLWTLAESEPARAFYEACGFRPDGFEQRRPSFGSPLEIRYRIGLRKKRR
jgi:ribosomal protein S18 acetylase RimI-like enzyme